MIPKVMAGSDFAGLKRYLVEDRAHNVLEPLGVPLDSYIAQMQMVAKLSSRCTKPVKHVTFAAAIEDGTLPDVLWLELVNEAEAEFGLTGHQRVVVRHRDKAYDHIHVFWCAVSANTGKTPKLHFRVADASFPELGPRALSVEQMVEMAPGEFKPKSYDAHALLRLQSLCRDFEKQHGLRQLATSEDARRAREAGQKVKTPARDRQQQHRVERTGDSLVDRAGQVRAALDAPDWDQRVRNLAAVGLGVRPAFAPSKNGPRLRGIVVHDLINEQNAVAASAFDTGTVKYGMAALDKRRDPATLAFADWWERRDLTLEPAAAERIGQQIRYAEERERHAANEARKAIERASVEQRYALEERELRSRLMARRRAEAKRLAADQRRPFYAIYDDTIRQPQLADLHDRRRNELASLVRKRMPSFATLKRKVSLIVATMQANAAKAAVSEAGSASALHRISALASAPALSAATALKTARTKLPGIQFLSDLVTEEAGVVPFSPRKADCGVLAGRRVEGVSRRFAQTVVLEHESTAALSANQLGSIDGYHPRLMPGGVQYVRPGEAPAFVEQGARITVKIDSDDALRAALKLALIRASEPIVVRADADVLERIYRLADALGACDRLVDGMAADHATERSGAATPREPPSAADVTPVVPSDGGDNASKKIGGLHVLAERESRRIGSATTRPKGPASAQTPTVGGRKGQGR